MCKKDTRVKAETKQIRKIKTEERLQVQSAPSIIISKVVCSLIYVTRRYIVNGDVIYAAPNAM